MKSVLIREYYIDRDDNDSSQMVVYTGRDTVCPTTNVEHLRRWADDHIPNWQNIELFRLDKSLPIFIGKEPK